MAEETEARGAGPQIENEKQFWIWLIKIDHPDICVALASRAALRTLPLITNYKETESNKIEIAASRLFRAISASWLTAKFPRAIQEYLFNLDTAINSALSEASSDNYHSSHPDWAIFEAAKAARSIYQGQSDYDELDRSFTIDLLLLSGGLLAGSKTQKESYRAVNSAFHSMESAKTYNSGSRIPDMSPVSSSSSSDRINTKSVDEPQSDRATIEFWQAVESDARLISSGASARQIINKPLWHDKLPIFVSNHWRALKAFLPDTDNWQVWKSWYEDILNGKAHSEAHDMIYATVPGEEWEKGPAAANAWIAARLAELDAKTSTASLTDPADIVAQENQATHEKDGPIDFFISYEKEDLGFARFVDSILRKAGYRVFVQFRDMPTGSDFLVEMNKGLSQSSRFISILSPRYNKSKMCQAEWNAAYHADPDGEKRKIIQYLIEATDLLPLARSRVYKSLVGLSQTQATEAILDAVGCKVSVDADVTWPGAEALDHMSQATKLLFDVALDDKRQLAPVANHALHQDTERLYGFSAESLYMDMREAIQDYAEYVCDTREGNFAFSSSIQLTARKLLEKTHEDWKKSNPLAINRALIHTLTALENADRNGDLPSGDINYHQNELRGMHQRLITIFPNLGQFREKARFERYVEPEPKALEAQTDILLKTSQDSTVTSPKLAHILRESQESLDELRELLLPETSKETRRKDLYEEHKNIATQIVPVWNWIVNAGAKIGKTGDDMSKTIENFEKLSKRIDNAKDYFDWLSKWFY